MTAIIKKNFRLQNARDFLDNFLNHPRMGLSINGEAGQAVSIEDDFAELSVDSSYVGTAKYTFNWQISKAIKDQHSNPTAIPSEQIKKDALLGLQQNLGAHVIDRNHYLFIGKSTPWVLPPGETTINPELSPPLPKDSLENERRIWDEMLGLKKISELDASLVIPRHNWNSAGTTVYTQFDDTKALHLEEAPFYVLTDQYDLFICIDNNNNSESTTKPVRLSSPTTLIQHDRIGDDGYVWKYITTIQSDDAVKFLTDSWIPIRTLRQEPLSENDQWSVQEAAVSGELLSCVVENQGIDYTNIHKGKLTDIKTVSSQGQAKLNARDGGANPSVVPTAYAGREIHISGTKYEIASYDGERITLTGAWNSQAPAENSEYEILPKLTVLHNGDSSQAVSLKPVVSGGKITNVEILSRGKNISFISISVPTSTAGGTGAQIRGVIGPSPGLGADPEKDLNAFFVMMNARLQYNSDGGDFPISNDYRQLGIVRNVLDSDGKLAKQNTLRAIKRLEVDVTGALPNTDSIVQQSTPQGLAKAIVIDVLNVSDQNNPNKKIISYIQTPATGFISFIKSADADKKLQKVEGTTVTTLGTITAEIQNEEVKKFVGEILYIENRRPILRAQDQLEDIKAIIEF